VILSRRNKKRSAPEVTNEQLTAAGTFVLALAAVVLTVKLIRNRTQRAAVRASLGLRADKGLADEVRRVARNEIDGAIASLTTEGEPVSAEAVHDARKRLKRLRALLRLTRHELGGKAFKVENRALRQIARRLSHSRDSDVMVHTLDTITRQYSAEIPPGAFDELRLALQTKANTERELLAVHAAAIRGAIPELHALRARVAGWPLPEYATLSDLNAGVRHVYKRGRDASDAARARPSTARLHRLRRRTKDMVHCAQILEGASPKAAKIVKRGKALNQLLGDDHDLAVLRAGAAVHGETLGLGQPQLLDALIDRRRATIQHEASDMAARLYRRTPKKVAKRFIAAD
jgi:CHAD domain-containing protein